MEMTAHSVSWEAPEHLHIEKTGDWYWILGIVAVAGSVASFIFGNVLFGVVILLGAVTMMIVSHRHPRIIPFEVSERGIRIDDLLYPYATLECFYLDEENTSNPQLIVKSKKMFVPLFIMPIPVEHAVHIDRIIGSRLPEEHMQEPLAHKILEFFGF
jgi:hypothetical protein